MREKKRRALQHVVAYVEYVVYVGHPYVELQLMTYSRHFDDNLEPLPIKLVCPWSQLRSF